MNKPREAWQSLKLAIRDVSFYRKDMEVIEELVKKATPTKPKSSQDSTSPVKSSIGICPDCNAFVMMSDYEGTENYCSTCSKALDWRKDD